jgi:sortase A
LWVGSFERVYPRASRPRDLFVTLLWFERALIAAGGILLTLFFGAHLDRVSASRAALRQFEMGRAQQSTAAPGRGPGDGVDFSLWSEERVAAFKASFFMNAPPVLGVLTLARLNIRVPVFEGTDDVTLNRGAGWIVGTAAPGAAGNSGIAAHRDGFFRGLKDVRVGDAIELQTAKATLLYRVSETRIVSPEDVEVLAPRATPSLTLVTCYPFYFTGSAPQRFIVHASIDETRIESR